MGIKQLISIQLFLDECGINGANASEIQRKLNRDWYCLKEDLLYLELQGDIYSVTGDDGVTRYYVTKVRHIARKK